MNRQEIRAAHAATTPADLAFALELAETPDEVDQAAHLSLCLFDVAGTFNPINEHGRTWRPLHNLVVAARTRVRGFHGDIAERTSAGIDAIGVAADARTKADRLAIHQAKEARIARLGFTEAKRRR